MSNNSNSSENVSSFIDKLLEAKDPATVGLRKIIRKKKDDMNEFPLKKIAFEEFHDPSKKGILSDEERRILELEKQVNEFDLRIKKQKLISDQEVKNAYERGKKDGINQGTETGKTEALKIYNKNMEDLQKNVSSCLKKIEDSKTDMISHSDHILLKLCIGICKKIVSSELTIREDIILNTIKKALTYIADRDRLIIRVSPDDLQTVNEGKGFWEPVNEVLKKISIEPDERIGRGGCIIESNNGVVDARLGIMFDEITDLIEKIWTNEHSLTANIDDVQQNSQIN